MRDAPEVSPAALPSLTSLLPLHSLPLKILPPMTPLPLMTILPSNNRGGSNKAQSDKK